MGLEPEARLNGDEARAKREKIRSLGSETPSDRDDYIFEWAFQIPLCSYRKKHKQENSLACVLLFVT